MSASSVPVRRASETALRWLRTGGIYGAWGLVVLFGVLFLVRDSLKYLAYDPEVYRRFWSVRWALAAHVAAASIALVLAPLQFIGALRRRWPRLHRGIGWIYVAAAAISFPAAFRLSMATSCSTCVAPFMAWSVVFVIATTLAVVMAVRGQREAHRQFMIRSYVLLNGFVVVRLDTHLEFPLGDVAGVERAGVLIWAAWVVPLILTEMWLSWSPLVSRALSRGRVR